MVAFDTSFLIQLLDGNAKAPKDPSTGQPVAKAAERINRLLADLKHAGERIIIPTPVLSEALVHAGSHRDSYLQTLNDQSIFEIVPFEQRAAIELATTLHDAIERGGHRVDAADPNVTKAKVKFDRQIIAIAIVKGIEIIYSEDRDIHNYAKQAELTAYRTRDIELPS